MNVINKCMLAVLLVGTLTGCSVAQVASVATALGAVSTTTQVAKSALVRECQLAKLRGTVVTSTCKYVNSRVEEMRLLGFPEEAIESTLEAEVSKETP